MVAQKYICKDSTILLKVTWRSTASQAYLCSNTINVMFCGYLCFLVPFPVVVFVSVYSARTNSKISVNGDAKATKRHATF